MLSEEYLARMEAELLEAQLEEAAERRCRIIPFPYPPEYDKAA